MCTFTLVTLVYKQYGTELVGSLELELKQDSPVFKAPAKRGGSGSTTLLRFIQLVSELFLKFRISLLEQDRTSSKQ